MRSILQVAADRQVGARAGIRGRAMLSGATILPALAVVLLLGSVAPASAGIGIDVQIAPPPVPAVVVPAPRVGFVWAPGYWQWNGRQHVWVEGRWLRARPGYRWVPEHWNSRPGHYRFVPGHWQRG